MVNHPIAHNNCRVSKSNIESVSLELVLYHSKFYKRLPQLCNIDPGNIGALCPGAKCLGNVLGRRKKKSAMVGISDFLLKLTNSAIALKISKGIEYFKGYHKPLASIKPVLYTQRIGEGQCL